MNMECITDSLCCLEVMDSDALVYGGSGVR